MESHDVAIVSADDGHCVGICEHVLLLCWRDEVSVTSLRAIRDAHFAMLRTYPNGVGCLTVRNGGRLQDGSLREASGLVRETYKNVRWAGCVVSGEGFVASAGRAGLTSILSIAGQSSLVKVFRDLPSAIRWQESHPSGLGMPATNLERAAAQIEAAMLRGAP